MILTSKELESLKEAVRSKKREIVLSLDLGISQSKASIDGSSVTFPDNERLDVSYIGKLDTKSCYLVQDGNLVKIHVFSPETNRHYKLVPTDNWPTVTISGVPMHQKTRMLPKQDAIEKTSATPIKGNVLDTCTGLGYTAILASQSADHVVTVERDENILELAKLNPYSQELFTSKKITVIEGDVFEVIHRFKDNEFDAIIHDPPTFKLAGELFGREFYRELYRVLKRDCWIFHYTGRFGIKSGRRFIDEVVKRLRESGFTSIRKVMDEQGVVCQKP